MTALAGTMPYRSIRGGSITAPAGGRPLATHQIGAWVPFLRKVIDGGSRRRRRPRSARPRG